jgi:hypothetical protein
VDHRPARSRRDLPLGEASPALHLQRGRLARAEGGTDRRRAHLCPPMPLRRNSAGDGNLRAAVVAMRPDRMSSLDCSGADVAEPAINSRLRANASTAASIATVTTTVDEPRGSASTLAPVSASPRTLSTRLCSRRLPITSARESESVDSHWRVAGPQSTFVPLGARSSPATLVGAPRVIDDYAVTCPAFGEAQVGRPDPATEPGPRRPRRRPAQHARRQANPLLVRAPWIEPRAPELSPVNQDSQPPGQRPQILSTALRRSLPGGRKRERLSRPPRRTPPPRRSLALFVFRREECPLARPSSHPPRSSRPNAEAPDDIVAGASVKHRVAPVCISLYLAPAVGLEPTTKRLTAARSTD